MSEEERAARLTAQFALLAEADRLKSVERANVLMDLSRQENSAEHSWHVALYSLVFGGSDRAIAMLLLHDLVEIDCGDQPVFLAHDVAALQMAEDASAERLFGLLGDGADLLAIWREFEAGISADAAFAKRMDFIQPGFQVLMALSPLPEHVEIARRLVADGRIGRLRGSWPEGVAAIEALLAGQPLPPGDLAAQLRFLAEADRLKSVYRASTLIDGSRRENSAEHSWHLALYALILAGHAGQGVDIGRVIGMLLIHDLVEIDVGDVPLHSAGGQVHGSAAVQRAEAAAAQRIFGLLPEAQGHRLRALWEEFEANETPDAIFAKSLDRTQPVLQNLRSGGAGWVEYGVGYDDVVQRVGTKIARGAPALWAHLDREVRAYFGLSA